MKEKEKEKKRSATIFFALSFAIYFSCQFFFLLHPFIPAFHQAMFGEKKRHRHTLLARGFKAPLA
jgi:glycopeptide antibiotics resistance protein